MTRRDFGDLEMPVMLGALAALVALGRGAHEPPRNVILCTYDERATAITVEALEAALR